MFVISLALTHVGLLVTYQRKDFQESVLLTISDLNDSLRVNETFASG